MAEKCDFRLLIEREAHPVDECESPGGPRRRGADTDVLEQCVGDAEVTIDIGVGRNEIGASLSPVHSGLAVREHRHQPVVPAAEEDVDHLATVAHAE